MPSGDELVTLVVPKAPPNDQAIRRSISRLHTDLQKATSYKGRGGAYLAQIAVAKFLRECRFPMSEQMLFVDLAIAIDDLEHGVIDPMLKQPKGKPNIRDAQRLWSARKNVAVILDTLNRCGLSKKDAIRVVRGRLERLDRLISSNSVKDADATIYRWLTQLQSGSVKQPEIVQAFREGKRTAQMLFPAIFRERENSPKPTSLDDHPNLSAWLDKAIAEIDDQIDRMGL